MIAKRNFCLYNIKKSRILLIIVKIFLFFAGSLKRTNVLKSIALDFLLVYNSFKNSKYIKEYGELEKVV